MSKNGPIDREDIYEEIARDLGVPEERVKEVVRHQFKFVKKVMAEGNYNSVRLPRFGIFEVKDQRIEQMKRHES